MVQGRRAKSTQTPRRQGFPCRSHARPDPPEEWHSRHHILSSKGNHGAYKTMRAYFDALPSVQLKGGMFTTVLAAQPREFDDLGITEIEGRVRTRCMQFPQFLAPKKKVFPTWPRTANPRQVAAQERPFSSCSQSPPPSYDELALVARVAARTASSTCANKTEVVETTCDGQMKPFQAGRMRSDGEDEEEVQATPRKRKTIALKKTVTRSCLADGLAPFKRLVDWLDQRHEHLVSLWRKLDSDGNMSLYKREFTHGLRALNYDGDLEALWSCLDHDHTGTVTFIEFDPEHAVDLARFKGWATNTFGSVKQAFRIMDEDRNGKVTFHEFAHACSTNGLPDRLKASLRSLFLLIDSDNDRSGKGSITEDELHFLDVWKPPAYLWGKPDYNAKQAFQNVLLKRHADNPLLAWRKVLDTDGSMRVNYDEFVLACRQLSQHGCIEAAPSCGLTALYVGFDDDHSGWFTLRDWDDNCFEKILAFHRLIKSEFARTERYVKKYEESEDEGVTFGSFRKSVLSLGFTHDDIVMLFEGLSLEQIHREHGPRKAARLHRFHLNFLDTWKPDEEIAEDTIWHELSAKRKLAS